MLMVKEPFVVSWILSLLNAKLFPFSTLPILNRSEIDLQKVSIPVKLSAGNMSSMNLRLRDM